MIYAVGTGRCGTGSYAHQTGGLHEPDPQIKDDAIYYRERGVATKGLVNALRKRASYTVPVISDNKQSLVIDLIKALDKSSEFVWIIRDPISCMVSYLRRGKWGQIRRWTPDVDGFDQMSDIKKAGMYWLHKNLLIEALLQGTDYKVIETNSLKDRTNRGDGEGFKINLNESWISESILPQWETWKRRYFDTCHSST